MELTTATMFFLAMLALPTVSLAATPDEARTFSERAAAHIKLVGEEKAFADFTRPDGGFVEGELYVFCYDHDGVNKAHGGNPLFVGKNLLHIKDPDGKEANLEIVKIGEAFGEALVVQPQSIKTALLAGRVSMVDAIRRAELAQGRYLRRLQTTSMKSRTTFLLACVPDIEPLPSPCAAKARPAPAMTVAVKTRRCMPPILTSAVDAVQSGFASKFGNGSKAFVGMPQRPSSVPRR